MYSNNGENTGQSSSLFLFLLFIVRLFVYLVARFYCVFMQRVLIVRCFLVVAVICTGEHTQSVSV